MGGRILRDDIQSNYEKPYAVLYADVPSRPNMPVNVLVGLEILKAGKGRSDEEMYENYCYNAQVRRALGLYKSGRRVCEYANDICFSGASGEVYEGEGGESL